MKNFTFNPLGNFLRFAFTFFLAFIVFSLMAQTGEDPTPTLSYPELYSAIVGALTMTWGYIAKALGLKNQVKSFVFVVLAGAVVIVGIFLALGFGDGISHVIAVLTSMGIFDLLKGATKKE